jgi:transposase-like protein
LIAGILRNDRVLEGVVNSGLDKAWRIEMKASKKVCPITPVQKGQIIQRVLVDRWSIAAAAAAFNIEKRFVAAWVADYRRHGMASLRNTPSRSLTAEIFRLRLAQPLALAWRRLAGSVRRVFVCEPAAQSSPPRHLHDDRRGAS